MKRLSLVIPDEEVQAAFDYLHEHADIAAKAAAERQYLEDYSKSLKALLMNERTLDSLGAQERYALSHPQYLQHLEALKYAVEADVKERYLKETKLALLDVWRSLSSREKAGLI